MERRRRCALATLQGCYLDENGSFTKNKPRDLVNASSVAPVAPSSSMVPAPSAPVSVSTVSVPRSIVGDLDPIIVDEDDEVKAPQIVCSSGPSSAGKRKISVFIPVWNDSDSDIAVDEKRKSRWLLLVLLACLLRASTLLLQNPPITYEDWPILTA